MAEHALYPAYVKLDYHSLWGRHVALFPTREWNPVSSGGTMGSYTSWGGPTVDAQAMIEGLIDHLKVFYLASASFDIATIYTIATPGASAIPKVAKSFGTPGTSTSTEQAKAAQQTWTLRDTEFNLARVVLLDAPVGAGFEPFTAFGTYAPVDNLVAQLTGAGNAWQSRAGFQLAAATRVCYDLSQASRKSYGMA